MISLTTAQENELRDIIAYAYTLAEMRVLSQDLGVESEDVSEETTRKMFAQKLVRYFVRRGRVDELIKKVHIDRPTRLRNSTLFDFVRPEVLRSTERSSPQRSQPSSGNNWSDTILAWLGALGFVLLIGGFIWFMSWQEERQLRRAENYVTNYFTLLDDDSCLRAWDKLSGDYRVNKQPTGIDPYCKYWTEFASVEILRLRVLEETGLTASVDVFLALTSKDGSVTNQSSVYKLTRTGVEATWTIADSSP